MIDPTDKQTKSFPLPYDRRLSLPDVVQGFAPPGTPFAGSLIRRAGVAALDLPGLPKGLGIQKAGGAIYRDAPRGVTLNTDERSSFIVIRHANSCIYRDASRIIIPCPASMEMPQ